MRRICEICGSIEPNILSKLGGIGFVFKLKKCSKCGLIFCTNCAVAKSRVRLELAKCIRGGLVRIAKCPRCNPNGYRGDGNYPIFSSDGNFIGWIKK